MNWKACLFFAAAVMAILGLWKTDAPSVREVRSRSSDEYDYLLYRNARCEPPGPLLIYLHGSGEIGKGFSVLKKRNPHRWAKEHLDGFVLAVPLATREGWNGEKLLRLAERLCREEQVDPDRIYLTGYSMGGGAAFRIAADRPDLFAAIVPVAGGGHPDNAAALQHMPVWALHGERDEIIPLFHASDMIDALQEADNTDTRLTILPGVGHGIAAEVYSRPEIYHWLLQQRRKK